MLGGREIDQIQPNGTLRQIKRWDIFTKSDKQFAKVESAVVGTLQVVKTLSEEPHGPGGNGGILKWS